MVDENQGYKLITEQDYINKIGNVIVCDIDFSDFI